MIYISLKPVNKAYILIKKGITLDKKILGKQLKQIRIDRGFSQEKLSEMIDISPRQMCVIENGNSLPSLDTFIKIAQTLHFDINEFFDINAEPVEKLRTDVIKLVQTADRKNLCLIKDLLLAVEKNI